MKLKSLAFLSSLFVGATSMAGWSSGGGELIRDKNNPWFLQNTSTVKYCIQIDEKNFGQSRADVTRRVQNAIAFWKRQLADLEYNSWTKPTINLGTQEFIEEKCSKNSDIVFQFGILTNEQKSKLGSTSDIIGLSVRTDYDRVNLKGKGFIYFAPESGPLKPIAKDVADHMWSSGTGAALYQLIIHELGHVFGIQHNSDVMLMGEDFAEKLVLKTYFQKDKDTFFEENFSTKMKLFKFFPESIYLELRSCLHAPDQQPIHPIPPVGHSKKFLSNNYERIESFFNLPDTHDCFYTTINKDELLVKGTRKVNHQNDILGSMKLDQNYKKIKPREIIKLWMDASQNVFQKYSLSINEIDVATMYTGYVFKGNYKTIDNVFTKRIAVVADPSGHTRISGSKDGEVFVDIENGF